MQRLEVSGAVRRQTVKSISTLTPSTCSEKRHLKVNKGNGI